MIDTILFDLDDTLLDFTANEEVALVDTLFRFGVVPTGDIVKQYIEINRACWQRLERGEWTREEVLVGRFRELYARLGVNSDPAATHSYYEKRLSQEGTYIEGARELLIALGKKYRLYAVSNGTEIVQDGRIASTRIDRHLDGIFISGRVGADKPSPIFFDRVFEAIGGERGHTVIVGDSLTSDILGGVNAGIQTVWYNPQGRENNTGIIPNYEIGSLSELPSLIEKI